MGSCKTPFKSLRDGVSAVRCSEQLFSAGQDICEGTLGLAASAGWPGVGVLPPGRLEPGGEVLSFLGVRGIPKNFIEQTKREPAGLKPWKANA